MKIYYKRNFLIGALLLLLGALTAAVGAWRGFNIYLAALAVLLLAVGAYLLFRSLSKDHARRDRIEHQDERDHLMLLKARSFAFRASQVILALCLGAGLLGCWSLRETEHFFLCFAFCAGLGLALAVLRAALLLGFLDAEQST